MISVGPYQSDIMGAVDVIIDDHDKVDIGKMNNRYFINLAWWSINSSFI